MTDWLAKGGGGLGGYTTPSREDGRVGRWCSRREALPRHRARAGSQRDGALWGHAGDKPGRSAMAPLMLVMVEMVMARLTCRAGCFSCCT